MRDRIWGKATITSTLALVALVTACGDRRGDLRRPGVDGGPTMDSGPPPGFDSGPPPGFDSGPPPGFDSGPPPGFDSGPPPGFDSGPPPAIDGGPIARDGGRDGGPIVRDGGRDGGPIGFDAGRPGCDVGAPCDPTRGCALSSACVDEFMTSVGDTNDPIVGLPGGATTIPLTTWTRGYCTDTGPVDSGGCDPADDTSCGGPACAVCVNAGTDSRGVTVGLCASSCTPSLTTNPCRDTYECSRTTGACLPGCSTDNECRIVRPDTNGNGYIDPYDRLTHATGDRLTYDASTSARCNRTTWRCEHNGRAGARAGATCDTDFDCQQNGDCIADYGSGGGWPGGYCTKFGCDIPGNACVTGDKCQERGIGLPMCVTPCRVAQNVVASDRFSGAVGCRAGHACFWDGVGTSTNNGACIPGNYNVVRTPNVGASCTSEASCYSPYGLGQCRDFGDGGQCTMFDCGAPGMPAGVCGTGALCASVDGTDTTLCLEQCTNASSCLAGSGCWDTTIAGIDTGGVRVCFPGCLVSTDCRTGQTCVGATATMVGQCM